MKKKKEKRNTHTKQNKNLFHLFFFKKGKIKQKTKRKTKKGKKKERKKEERSKPSRKKIAQTKQNKKDTRFSEIHDSYACPIF